MLGDIQRLGGQRVRTLPDHLHLRGRLEPQLFLQHLLNNVKIVLRVAR